MKNVIIISEEFMFDKFSILHYFGKMLMYLSNLTHGAS